jgi:hypothetical protein
MDGQSSTQLQDENFVQDMQVDGTRFYRTQGTNVSVNQGICGRSTGKRMAFTKGGFMFPTHQELGMII